MDTTHGSVEPGSRTGCQRWASQAEEHRTAKSIAQRSAEHSEQHSAVGAGYLASGSLGRCPPLPPPLLGARSAASLQEKRRGNRETRKKTNSRTDAKGRPQTWQVADALPHSARQHLLFRRVREEVVRVDADVVVDSWARQTLHQHWDSHRKCAAR
eukprot:907030-Rhodomonas_salina.2